MKIRLSQLQLLLAVADTGSISAAARHLGMTQSGASQGLIALERAMGADLLARSRDGVTPTAFGESVIAEARHIARSLDRIAALADIARSAVRPVLNIASVPSTAKSLLPHWIRTFRRLYPETELTVLEGHHVEVCDWIHRGIADLGFAALAPTHLRAEPIRDEPLTLVARRDHRLLHVSALTMNQLAQETLVTGGFGCEPVLDGLFNEAGLAAPTLVQAQDVATALEIVRQGFGVSLLPDTALLRTNLADLRTRPLPVEVRRRLYLIASGGSAASATMERLLEIIRQQPQPVVATH